VGFANHQRLIERKDEKGLKASGTCSITFGVWRLLLFAGHSCRLRQVSRSLRQYSRFSRPSPFDEQPACYFQPHLNAIFNLPFVIFSISIACYSQPHAAAQSRVRRDGPYEDRPLVQYKKRRVNPAVVNNPGEVIVLEDD
jgi:hypothetical protein